MRTTEKTKMSGPKGRLKKKKSEENYPEEVTALHVCGYLKKQVKQKKYPMLIKNRDSWWAKGKTFFSVLNKKAYKSK